MIVRRLELQLDMRRPAESIIQGLLDLFPGGINGHFPDLGLEISMASEINSTPFADDAAVICRIIGDNNSVVSTLRAGRRECKRHEIIGH